MLEEITEKCTDLLLKHNSPVSQLFEVDFNADANTLYQRFAFIKSIIDSEEFTDSIHKILLAPVTRWKESETEKDLGGIRRINNTALRQIAGAKNRNELPEAHFLKSALQSIPSKIRITHKKETVNTPENRFVKYALTTFLLFIGEFRIKLKGSSRVEQETFLLEDKLEQFLNHSIFKEILLPTTLPLNSPILQRKEGYREVLRVWLMFDLAAKLVWHGGDDVYYGGKKDVAVLYEYWLFFKLLEIIGEIFKIEPKSIHSLIGETNDGLGLQLRQGKYFPIHGVFQSPIRNLEVEFSYNRAFSGEREYPLGGSWTKNMRPDYTLSIWPVGISQTEAEAEELIVHIHFDAKYKVDKISEIFGDGTGDERDSDKLQEELSNEKAEQNNGNFKRVDLLKMHSYKDAIRRTGGAYVLYPGEVNDKPYIKAGFHELIPGLGAFAIRPSKTDTGAEELKKFLNEVVKHFLNRASQREKISLKTYQTYRDRTPNELAEALPETYGLNRSLLPDETFVLVGYATSTQRFKWYEENNKYVFRMGKAKGSLELNNEVVNAKYLLLRKSGKDEAADLFVIMGNGPKVYSQGQLDKLNYPQSRNPKEYYLVIEIKRTDDEEFKDVEWNFKELKRYQLISHAETNPYSKVGLPFTVTLTELMQVVKK